jgi:hypothetical protein
MPIDPITGVARANDKYRAQLRSTWISDPADTSLLVNAVPENVPTIVVAGWGTDLETVFSVEGKSGDSSSNYALTGVVRLKGANTNLPENTAVNCLNNEEFFNQYEEKINEIIDGVNTALEDIDTALDQFTGLLGVSALTDGATPALDASLGSIFTLSAEGNRTIAAPTNESDGKKIIIVHHASGGARTLSLTTGAGGFLFGADLTEIGETESGKRDLIGAVYNLALDRWLVVAVVKGFSV